MTGEKTGDNQSVIISKKRDFTYTWFSGTGAGGQHRNKHQNCIRLTHTPSNITVTAQNFRSRKQNLADAFSKIIPQIQQFYFPDQQKERAPNTSVVRTYNIPDNRVKDHASGLTIRFDQIDIDHLIIERKKALIEDENERRSIV